MRIELVCVGSELLSGKLNSNIGYIGGRLNTIGLRLDCCVTLPDDGKLLKNSMKEVFTRADVTIVTGGLGPTFDDITRESAAAALNRKLVLKRDVLAGIAGHFVKRGFEMPRDNDRQAYVLEGAEVIPNRSGTAPGQALKAGKGKDRRYIVLLPGPPGEMQPMFESAVMPYLKKMYERRIIRQSVLHVAGMGESRVNELIKPIVETERKLEQGQVRFTILAHRSIIDVKTEVEGENELIVDEILHNIRKELRDILGDNIYGQDGRKLEEVVGELCIKNRKTVSVAESCTGGLISSRITDVSGSSAYFLQGAVTYSNSSKTALLGVHPDTIRKHGAVSGETAVEMARGMRKISSSDYALSVTGIAGPAGATGRKKVGQVFFGLVFPGGELTEEKKFAGSRHGIKERAANHALDMIRRQLIKKKKKTKGRK